MKKPSALMVLVLLSLLAWVAPRAVTAYPQPSIVSQAWEFDFSHGTPQPIAVTSPGGDVDWFWYMTYKVVNNTDQERPFFPEITVATDTGDILVASANISPAVFDAIKAKVGNNLLEHPLRVGGRLLLGEDNAKESVAVWPAFPHDVDQVNLFISGLSGETQATPHPVTGEPVVLRKTLMIQYATPGTDVHPQQQTVEPEGEKWILR